MGRDLALVAGIALALCCARMAIGQPSLRHVNIIAISAPQGTTIDCEAACEAHGAYEDWLTCRLVRPDGYIAASARAAPGETQSLSVRVEWEGRCAIEASSGWNLGQVRFAGDIPHAYRSQLDSPLKTVGAWGPLHFHVPKGTEYFNVWVQASVTREGLHIAIKDPAGQIALEQDGDFDERTKLQLQVGGGQDDAEWSIELSRPTTEGLNLDDVYVELGRHLPPLLAPKPEWARLFAGDWRYDPDAPQPSTRLEPTEPTLEPFPGVTGPEIDQAYSRDTDEGWRTSLPFTYILDYGSKHLGNPEYVPTVATAPPALLHLGKDVPFNHGWGPIKALGGENQAYGTDEYIARLAPEQVQERIEGLREMANGLHESGVRWVTPYVCGMTLDGDERARTGFWEFYDHWNEYLPLGLAPRPKTDPFEWLQRNPDGTPHQYYRYNYPDEHYPPFKTNHRYAACWRREGWPTWLGEVVRFAARCGYDGVFVDNANSQRCQCDVCLAAFREYLKGRYTVAEAQRLFGDTPLDEITFPTGGSGPLVAEMNRFWCETVRQELAALKEVGTKELGREFIVFPNGGRPESIQRGLMDADFVMFEKSVGDYGTNPGMVLSPVFEGVSLRAYNDNIFEHKFVQCLRRRVRPIILSRPGYPRTLPHLVMNANAARLGMAECGAFSGGGGFLLRPDFGVYHDALNEFRRFFETRPQLSVGMDSYAQVGVLAFAEQGWLGNGGHIAAVRSLTDALTEAHVLIDYVSESMFGDERLERYSTLVAADLQYVSDAQLRAVAEYVRNGGHLVTVRKFATHDEATAERDPQEADVGPLLAVPPGQTQERGQGRVTCCATIEDVPSALGATAPVLSCADEQLGAHVKVNAFRTLDEEPARIVVHVVNYNVPLGVEAPEPEPIERVELAVPLPEGSGVASATGHAPGEREPVWVDVEVRDGTAHVSLPALGIYRVVELKLSE
jgi:hypothetical protein